jgi:hypothetical protein
MAARFNTRKKDINLKIKDMSEKRIFEITKRTMPKTAKNKRTGVLKLTITSIDQRRKIISFAAPVRAWIGEAISM